MRSLDRRSMYRIFAPLDAGEPLPRELLLEGRRHRTVGRRELAGALWLPALAVVLLLAAWGNVNGIMALGVIVMLFVTFWAFARSGERKSP
jgi:hypothetical protein